MLQTSRPLFRFTPTLLLCCLLVATWVPRGVASEALLAPPDAAPSATVSVINRLVERGVLSRQDGIDLIAVAEADAADARAQAAVAQAALAQAAAAQARVRALQSELRLATGGQAPAVAAANPVPAPAATAPAPVNAPAPMVPPASVVPSVSAAVPIVAVAPPAAPAVPAAAPAENNPPADVVRVTYIPEVVRQQLREEVKQDVMEQARRENWASPRTFPDWVTRFRLFGDLRTRSEGLRFPAGNDNTGSFPNFNAINTGAPFDVSGTQFSPQYNVDQARNRVRLRTRMGAAIDLGQSFTAGVRVATGESNSPVTQNQSLGAAGSGQGGNFGKYGIWLDRGFIRYEWGGQPDNDYLLSVGRFDNPFFATSNLWADDLGFDGAALQGKFPLTGDITPFFTVGAFPIFNTDLNFASNQPAKFKSNDKWLGAAQLGASIDLGRDFAAKAGVAYYQFTNVAGNFSSPFTPLTSSDAGDTDATRPSFAQKGNTYMAIRNITAGPLNGNGTINQFQYFGLATPFQVTAADVRFEYNRFEPFQVALTGEYLKNRAFDPARLTANAVNNRGAPTAGANPQNGAFLGGPTAWLVNLSVGDAVLQKRWDWNTSFGYRRIESDAVIDGFNDSDFGGGGTNVKGFVLAGNVTLSPGVWLGLKWMSASEVAGPAFKSDTVQLDLNAKF